VVKIAIIISKLYYKHQMQSSFDKADISTILSKEHAESCVLHLKDILRDAYITHSAESILHVLMEGTFS
jgi:hypothetical protein